MLKLFIYLWRIIRTVITRIIEDRLTYSASVLTYTTLLALVPLLAVILGILSAFPVFSAIALKTQQFIFSNFIPESGEVIRAYLQNFIAQTGKLSLVGTLFLVIAAIMMMMTVDSALNDIWQVKKSRYTWSAIIRYWAVLSLAPICVSLSIAATSYLISFTFITKTAITLKIMSALSGTLPYLLTFIAFSLIYIIVPNCPVPLFSGLIGAVIATCLFELAKKLFVFYLSHFSAYRLIYGAIATIPIFLLWLYISWLIILFGALISNILLSYSYLDGHEKLDGFTHTLLWLGCLWRAQQKGEGLTLRELYQAAPKKTYHVEPHQLIRLLKKKQLIHLSESSQYRLSRDFSTLTLAELYDLLPWKLPDATLSPVYSKDLQKLFNSANQLLKEKLQIPLAQIYDHYG